MAAQDLYTHLDPEPWRQKGTISAWAPELNPKAPRRVTMRWTASRSATMKTQVNFSTHFWACNQRYAYHALMAQHA